MRTRASIATDPTPCPRPTVVVTQKIPQLAFHILRNPDRPPNISAGSISAYARGQASGALLVLALPCRVVQVIMIL
jgi:hypothetical protein